MESHKHWMTVDRLKTEPPFMDLFPIDDKTLKSIGEHMEAHGYDEAQPIIVWERAGQNEENRSTVVDGHTRLQAAKQAGLASVYVASVDFADERTALDYAIHNQRDRRNLGEPELWRCIQWIDKRNERGKGQKRKRGRFQSKAQDCANGSRKSSKQTAQILGISSRKVEQARTVLDHGDQEIKAAIESGSMSINKAYQVIQKKRRAKRNQSELKEEANPLEPKYRYNRYTGTFQVSDAMECAVTAMAQLEKIAEKDPKRADAYRRIQKWLVSRKALSADFESLEDLHSIFVKALISFMQGNQKNGKSGGYHYAKQIQSWVSELGVLTEDWIRSIDRKK